MNFWRYLSSRHQQLLTDAYQHTSVVFQCMVVATLIGVVIGVVTYHSDWAGGVATTTTSTIASCCPGTRGRGRSRCRGRGRRHTPRSPRCPSASAWRPGEVPGERQVLDPITKKLDNDVAQTLNSKVDVDGQDPHQVALDWRKQEGFVKGG